MPEKVSRKLAKRFHVNPEQVRELLGLLQDGLRPMFILRYRKDLAANLNADDIYSLAQDGRRLELLDKERRKFIKKLQEQEVLTEELEQRIQSAETMRELIDYYVPFRPRKHSRSRQAYAQGLEVFAHTVFAQDEPIPLMSEAAAEHVDAEKELDSVGAVLDGVFHIICDWVAEEKSHRDRQRDVLREQGEIVSRRGTKSLPPRLRSEFKEFIGFQAKIKDVHPHQMMSLIRGRRLKALSFRIEAPLLAMCKSAADLYMSGGAEQFSQIDARFHESETIPEGEQLGELSGAEFLYFCIRESLCEVLSPILTREFERELGSEAENMALEIVRRNLRGMLMLKPSTGQRVLGIWPGYRTGCKLAALDEGGSVLETGVVYPHTPRLETDEAMAQIAELVRKHKLGVAVIGEGNALQETEALICEVIAQQCPELRYVVVDSTAVQGYASSHLAEKELPSLPPELRTAVSIGRRFLDPLSELTKVNLSAFCLEQIADDVNSAALKTATARVAEECVALVGVDLNDAPETLLRCVPGLAGTAPADVVDYRASRGPFPDRKALRDVPKVDEQTWRRTVGFVRVRDSKNPLDRTRIHPDNYPVAESILNQLGVVLEGLDGPEAREQIKTRRGEIDFSSLEKQFGVHYLLIKGILDELVEPWPDPRMQEQGPVLRQRPLTFEDLKADQVLAGTVRKIVGFGVFVDVGVGEDGLVHISELSDHFVQSPYDVVTVGEQLKVRVIEVDSEKRRIALSMRPPGSRRLPPRKGPPRPRPDTRAGSPGADHAVAAGRHAPRGGHAPQSTVGAESRRVQKAASYKVAAGAHPHGQAGQETDEEHGKLAPQKGEKQAHTPRRRPSCCGNWPSPTSKNEASPAGDDGLPGQPSRADHPVHRAHRPA